MRTRQSDSRAKVFLSHSSKDKDVVRAVAQQLEDVGVPCWLDESEIKIGESLINKLAEAIELTSHVIVFLSRASVASDWVKFEVEQAMTKEIKGRIVVVLPVLLEKCEVPLYLRHKCYADFSDLDEYGDQFARLVASVRPGASYRHGTEVGASRARLLLEERLRQRYQELLAVGRNFHEQGDAGNAKRVFLEAVELAPYAAGAYVNLGLVSASQGAPREAERYWLEALKRDPHRETALFNLGMFHLNAGEFDKAKEYFRKTIEQEGDYSDRAREFLRSLRASKGKWVT